MVYTAPIEPKEIWEYTTRTLTTTQFPFWSSVITQQENSGSVADGSSVYIDIQPPAGETWYLEITLGYDTVDSYLRAFYYDYDGTSARLHGMDYPSWSLEKILTNSLYARLRFYNNTGSGAYNYFYGYSGFKLGTELVEIEDLKYKGKRMERKTKYKIPSIFNGLEDLIYDVYNFTTDEYEQVIYLERDTPIHRDKRTGHIICKRSVCVETKKFKEILEKIRLNKIDIKKWGYADYINAIKEKREIDLLQQ